MKNLLPLLFMIFGVFYANAQRFHTNEEQTLTICDTDITPGGITADYVQICQSPARGTVAITSAAHCVNYTPNTNYFGYDSYCISYCIGGVCTDTTINVTIHPVGETVIVNNTEDAISNQCRADLAGNAPVTFSICSPPGYGVASTNPLCVIYDPIPNFVGYDTMCLSMCIDTLCDTSTIVYYNTPVTETINITDNGNGSTICYADLMTQLSSLNSINISTAPNSGTASVNGSTNCVDYVPDPAVVATGNGGSATLTITACDANGVCDATTVNITILGFTITNNTNATQLAQSLAGNGVSIVGIPELTCNDAGSATFINAPNALGISDGVLLSSGNALNVKNSPGFQDDGEFYEPGDSDLDILLNQMGETYPTSDACVLEFDIQVLGDSLTFNYVMGSEEYPDYVCSEFNDIFGFFISGQNPLGGTYNSQNIALIPNTNIPVAINTVNSGIAGGTGAASCDLTNSAYFNGAINPYIKYNGNTVVLQAKALTVPCSIYSFKLAIADGAGNSIFGPDVTFDSGVFLEAGSFQSIPVSIASQTNLGSAFTNAVEGCVEGEFIFQLTSPLPNNYTIHFGVGGTAVNGVDYQLVEDSVVIPAGDTTFTVNINTIDDGIAEGTETIKLYLLNP